MAIVLIEATDAHFAWMLGAGSPPAALRLPPGGVDTRFILEKLRGAAGYATSWMIVTDGEVVGLCSYKRPPGADGAVEIGFGIAASRRRQGHATRAIAALVEAASRDSNLRSLIAETATANAASQRVLARNGFIKTGTRSDPQAGDFILWRRGLGQR
jgi:RimJ/RimL family protein N-acetyltransferase